VDPITLTIDSRVYTLDVVQRAAFRCSDLASFNFSIASELEISVVITIKASLDIKPSDICARFESELLDQQLRQTIADETKVERDLILAYAFSNTKLLV
jgi:His-Xaa-Ser system protein HxsD